MSTKYLPLNTNEIRVLSPQPAEEQSSPLLCQIHHHGLSDGGVYNAISYVWGDQTAIRAKLEVTYQSTD